MKPHGHLILGLLLATAPLGLGDWYSRWNGAGNTWYEKWNNVLNTVESIRLDERMDLLGKGVMLGSNGMPSGEKKEIFTRAQSILLSTPGHAKYYQNQIEETRELVREHAKLPKEEQYRLQAEGKWKGLGDYEDVRNNAFGVLGLLPSPETVAVLGHFIEDPEGRDHKDMLGNPIQHSGDCGPFAPNCGKAFFAFAKLGIEHPPAKVNYPDLGDLDYDLDRVDKWKDWWKEVKTGKRTYRFVGSNIEYGPDGPATKEQLEKIAKDRKRADEQRKRTNGAADQGNSSTDGLLPKAPFLALVFAGAAVLASLVWYFRKAKRTS
jgi:hypothetical protein